MGIPVLKLSYSIILLQFTVTEWGGTPMFKVIPRVSTMGGRTEKQQVSAAPCSNNNNNNNTNNNNKGYMQALCNTLLKRKIIGHLPVDGSPNTVTWFLITPLIWKPSSITTFAMSVTTLHLTLWHRDLVLAHAFQDRDLGWCHEYRDPGRMTYPTNGKGFPHLPNCPTGWDRFPGTSSVIEPLHQGNPSRFKNIYNIYNINIYIY